MLVDVHFKWDDEHGFCDDCGLPAAFLSDDLPNFKRQVCAVCAANDAAQGCKIKRIDPHFYD